MSWFKLNSGNWLHQDGTLPVKKKGGGIYLIQILKIQAMYNQKTQAKFGRYFINSTIHDVKLIKFLH